MVRRGPEQKPNSSSGPGLDFLTHLKEVERLLTVVASVHRLRRHLYCGGSCRRLHRWRAHEHQHAAADQEGRYEEFHARRHARGVYGATAA